LKHVDLLIVTISHFRGLGLFFQRVGVFFLTLIKIALVLICLFYRIEVNQQLMYRSQLLDLFKNILEKHSFLITPEYLNLLSQIHSNFMAKKMIKKIILVSLLSFLLQIQANAQTKKWTTQTTKDKITVKSCISDTLIDSETRQLVEYISKIEVVADYDACIAVLKNISLHKQIFEYTEKSVKVKELSANEWIIYYFLDVPWPMPNSDSVIKMKFTTDKANNSTYFYMTTSPKSVEDKGYRRVKVSNSSYTIKKLANNKVSIVSTTYSVPTIKAPDWLANSWIPEGPANILRNIVKLSKTQNK